MLRALALTVLFPIIGAPQQGGHAAKGKKIYQERCVLCHGSQGHGWDWYKKAGRPPVPVPNLSKVVPQRSDGYLMTVIRDGGVAVGLTRFMPAFGFNMTEQDLKDMVAYLRSLQLRVK